VSTQAYGYRWLRRVAPGTLLYMKSDPDMGFWLIYHCKVMQHPIEWYVLTVDVVDPRLRLTQIELEVQNFFERWAVVEGTCSAVA
jgi:hypothetical protein